MYRRPDLANVARQTMRVETDPCASRVHRRMQSERAQGMRCAKLRYACHTPRARAYFATRHGSITPGARDQLVTSSGI
eukprot:451515-Prymnesium_polylepis.1